ncbi:MAG: hypothetical protein U0166_18250 [Acidobacteriota bacterium]
MSPIVSNRFLVIVTSTQMIAGTILLAIAYDVPSRLHHRCDVARQAGSMRKMHRVAHALALYHDDHDDYPDDQDEYPKDRAEFDRVVTAAGLRTPVLDGWGHPVIYEARRDEAGHALGYTVTSVGRDGTCDGPVSESSSGVAKSPDADIVLSDGWFLQAPWGIEKS